MAKLYEYTLPDISSFINESHLIYSFQISHFFFFLQFFNDYYLNQPDFCVLLTA